MNNSQSSSQTASSDRASRALAASPWPNRSAVISGGSSGLGLTLAEALAPQVDRLVITGRSSKRLADTKSQLLLTHPHLAITNVAVDAATSEGSAELARVLQSELGGRFDLLINAVGSSDRGRLIDLKPDRLHELLNANVTSTLLTTQAVLPSLQPGSVIVNIGSLAGLFAPRFLGGYSIAKHGVTALSQQLRLELAEQGLHVLLVCPGPIRGRSAAERYAQLDSASNLPAEAMQGGGGAKIRGLDPERLARDILSAAIRRERVLIRPRKAKLLRWISALWPWLGDSLLRRMTS
ncbi:MAG: SDR family oxidoreductase [Pirellulales bacterium]